MKKSINVYLIILTIILGSNSIAQVDLNFFSLQAGAIGGIANPHYVFYPEAQVGGFLGEPFIQWSLYWGYWDDGITSAPEVTDNIEYTYSAHIVGARFFFLPAQADNHWPLPIALWAGIAHHFISRTYLAGSDYSGIPGSNGSESINTVEAGLRLYFKITRSTELRAEGHQFFRLGDEPLDQAQTNRTAYSVGLAFLL